MAASEGGDLRERARRHLWTTVRLSETIDQPQQDLSPRVIEALKESPGAFLGLIFRQVGDWLEGAFGEE